MELEQINFITEPEQINMSNTITNYIIMPDIQTNFFSGSFSNASFLFSHKDNFKSKVSARKWQTKNKQTRTTTTKNTAPQIHMKLHLSMWNIFSRNSCNRIKMTKKLQWPNRLKKKKKMSRSCDLIPVFERILHTFISDMWGCLEMMSCLFLASGCSGVLPSVPKETKNPV